MKRFNGLKKDWVASFKRHANFNEGENLLYHELDVITLLKSMRRVKLLTQSLFTYQQKMLLMFQRKNMIESESSSGDSDTNNKFDMLNMMESPKPMMKLAVFAKLKKMV